MAGQTIVMITLAHDRHGPGSGSLPTGTDTITTSSLTLSSANTMSAPAASNTDDCGVVQSFYGQTAASWEAIDMDTWLNVWFLVLTLRQIQPTATVWQGGYGAE